MRRKPEARSSKLETNHGESSNFKTGSCFGNFPCIGNSNLFRISCFVFRIFPLVAIAFFFLQVSSVAKADPSLTSPGTSSSNFPSCTGAQRGRRRTKQHRNLLPDSSNDLDAADGGPYGSAITPTGHDQDVPHFTNAGVSIILRAPSFVTLRQPSRPPHNSFLREHIRERAPPSLSKKI